MPFFLNTDNSLPAEGVDLREYISKKYGRMEGFDKMFDQMRRTGERVGIKFNPSRKVVPTMHCHRIMHWVHETYDSHTGDLLMEEMFKSYFEEATNIGDKQSILACIDRIPSINRLAAEGVLNNDALYKMEVINLDQNAKRKLNVHGVPFFIIEREPPLKAITFSGAQVLQYL